MHVANLAIDAGLLMGAGSGLSIPDENETPPMFAPTVNALNLAAAFQHPRLLADSRHTLAREFAKKEGQVYYEGSPCKNGHDGLRYASTANCVTCQKAARRAQLDRITSDKDKRGLT